MTDSTPNTINPIDCECEEEHEEMYECANCGVCTFGKACFKESHQTYEENPTCLECALNDIDDMTNDQDTLEDNGKGDKL